MKKKTVKKVKVKKFNGFSVEWRSNLSGDTCKISILSSSLASSLREISDDDILYHPVPILLAQDLFCLTPKINESNPELAGLAKFLNEEFVQVRQTIQNLTDANNISFEFLWFLFKKGDSVVFDQFGTLQGGKVSETRYVRGMFGDSFHVNVQMVVSDGKEFFVKEKDVVIQDFKGVKSFKHLSLTHLDAATKQKLHERGKRFMEICAKPCYLDYDSNIIWREWYGYQIYKANGRCMIDPLSFAKENPRYDADTKRENEDIEGVPDDMLFTCSAWAKGFSFFTKRWGEFSIDHLKPVVFNDTAFQTLVLPENTKAMIKALVENAGTTFQDIIYGKGGGCIFLLHGPPGTGKTLTAESIAELLHRPLYSVSVGELGITPETLETALRSILEMATLWNAVILIDEADIFLESRADKADITRNAMVAIFLRLLEYHQGVLFLTTNRVLSFDTAFHSRISIAIRYPDLKFVQRQQIWENLLKAANLDKGKFDVHKLSHYEINGRQIKTAIRLAQALSQSENVEISTAHLEIPLQHAARFMEEVSPRKEFFGPK